MYVHQSDDNEYFTVKAEIKFDVDTMLGMRGISSAAIARLYGDVVQMETKAGSEEETVMSVLYYYFVWKLAGALTAHAIQYVKHTTSEILASDRRFSCLDDEAYADFISLVRELHAAQRGVRAGIF